MTRQEAYVAELSQLLFYMTAWDKAEALKKVTRMFETAENEAELLEELGSPMKLAVKLNREYTPTPEPTAEELAARAAAEAAEAEAAAFEAAVAEAFGNMEAPAQVLAGEETSDSADEEAQQPEEVLGEELPAEEAAEAQPEAEAEEAAEEPAEMPAEEPVPEEVPETEAEEELPCPEEPAEAEEAAEEEAVPDAQEAEEEQPAEEAAEETLPEVQEDLPYEDKADKEKIFVEIFNAATEAQSAVPVDEPAPAPETERKARYWFLIPYTVLAVLVGVPMTLVFAVANATVFGAAIVSLCITLFTVIFHLLAAVDLGSKLIVLGISLVMLVITLLLSVMTVWFLNTATVGFPRFLVEVAKNYGYREVKAQ